MSRAINVGDKEFNKFVSEQRNFRSFKTRKLLKKDINKIIYLVYADKGYPEVMRGIITDIEMDTYIIKILVINNNPKKSFSDVIFNNEQIVYIGDYIQNIKLNEFWAG